MISGDPLAGAAGSYDRYFCGQSVMSFAERVRCPLSARLVCSPVVTSSFASDASVAVRPVPVAANRVTIDDAFWSPEVEDLAGGIDQ